MNIPRLKVLDGLDPKKGWKEGLKGRAKPFSP